MKFYVQTGSHKDVIAADSAALAARIFMKKLIENNKNEGLGILIHVSKKNTNKVHNDDVFFATMSVSSQVTEAFKDDPVSKPKKKAKKKSKKRKRTIT